MWCLPGLKVQAYRIATCYINFDSSCCVYRHGYFWFCVTVQQQVENFWGVLDRYMRGYHSLLKLTEVIRKNTKDPKVLSELDNLEKTLKGTNDSNDAN